MDANDYRTLLEQRGAKPDCPVCGHTGWADEFDFTLLEEARKPTVRGDVASLGPGFTTLTLICDNCGFTRLHALHRLDS